MAVPRMFRVITATGTVIFLSASASAPLVDYPAGYRQWTHITSGVNGGVHGPYAGMYHIYANAKAMRGYRTGHFPDGALIVFDLHDARSADEVIQPGERKFIDVMHKNARLFRSTGGWGYEEFAGGDPGQRRISPEAAARRCHSCHEAKQSADHVISRFRD